MKFLSYITAFLVMAGATCFGQGMRISAYPNTNNLAGTNLFIVAIKGSPGTNMNISWAQLSNLFNTTVGGQFVLEQSGNATNVRILEQTNLGGIWFTNVPLPDSGQTGIQLHFNTNLLFSNGLAYIEMNTNGSFGVRHAAGSYGDNRFMFGPDMRVIVMNSITNYGGYWFTNVAMPDGGSSGIYMLNNSNLVITNGAGSVLLNSNGNLTTPGKVGIGTNNPQALVDIQGTNDGNGYLFRVGSANVANGTNVFTVKTNMETTVNGRLVVRSPNYIDCVRVGYNAGGLEAGDIYSTFIGSAAGQNATYATNATMIGSYAGINATTATYASMIGYAAGYSATTATYASMIGSAAGYNATTATYASMIGSYAGINATTATYASMIGSAAGYNATTATYASMIGYAAGYSATTATYASMIGSYAGFNATTATYASMIGSYAGYNATNAEAATMIGYSAGNTASNAPFATFIGANSGSTAGFASTSNSIAIGYGATVNADNQIVIGNSPVYKTGLGTNIPQATLHVTGNNAQNVLQAGTTNKPSQVTLTTNGVLSVDPGGGLNPVGCYGFLGMNDTNLIVCAGAAGVYTNVSGQDGFTTITTNGFFGNTAAIVAGLTNLYPGWYRITIALSAVGANNQALEGEVFTNGVACDLVGFKKTYDAAARMDDMSMSGIIYLPANCGTQFMLQDAGTGGSVIVHRASLTIGTP